MALPLALPFFFFFSFFVLDDALCWSSVPTEPPAIGVPHLSRPKTRLPSGVTELPNPAALICRSTVRVRARPRFSSTVSAGKTWSWVVGSTRKGKGLDRGGVGNHRCKHTGQRRKPISAVTTHFQKHGGAEVGRHVATRSMRCPLVPEANRPCLHGDASRQRAKHVILAKAHRVALQTLQAN